ncbi:MAG: DNA topoisomerase (ATP-hydrolyzing) subunit B [Bifidobacteriaceae bacterium]|jgi:DNA gyrase subunit B|nr:DNA topoisomerase (ATP-hydrolyzing) subunit B [Bifidobacteriaceae bacterium]
MSNNNTNEQASDGSNKQNLEYGSDDITILEGLEAVRKRPGMYIGSTGEKGLHHLVYEVVDNSVDEALAGYATYVDITILQDGAVRVIDDGRGIPVDVIETEGISALEVVLTQLHAGGKFGGGGYTVSGGLHGVGISVVNALSTYVKVISSRQGHEWTQEYEYGIPKAPISKGEATEKTGTTVIFYPNGEIFETIDFSFETLRARLEQMAFLNKGLKLTLTDQRIASESDDEITGENKAQGKNTVTYIYQDGLKDYVKHINKHKKSEVIHDEIIYIEKEDSSQSLELAMQWTAAYSESIYTFANTISTTEGGTHEEGFRTALTSLINKYARDKQYLKEKDENLTGDDVREGLSAVISVKLTEPQFEGQTKTKLGNTEIRTFVQKVMGEVFKDWLDSHPKESKTIVQRSMAASQARIAARKAREATRKKSVFESNSLPDKLKDCKSNNPEDCEIFIVEGDSAGGSAIQGRNPDNQAILALRGKILNVEKVRIDRMLSSETIQNLISAVGTGIGQDFDAEKVRYHKIILMSDADVDGAHIATLLLTFFFRHMQQLISLGYIYLAQPPLYRIKWSNADHDFVYSDYQRDETISEGRSEGRKLPKEGVQRYKGLGEMSHAELRDTTMDPDKRVLIQITMEDAASADEIFTTLMGEDVLSRRQFIQRNAKDVRFLDI